MDDPSEYGIVQLDDDGRITRFLEKPKGEVFSKTANTGVYVFEPQVFDLMPARRVFPVRQAVVPTDDGARNCRCTAMSPKPTGKTWAT